MVYGYWLSELTFYHLEFYFLGGMVSCYMAHGLEY